MYYANGQQIDPKTAKLNLTNVRLLPANKNVKK
jgi:hypothetical protein